MSHDTSKVVMAGTGSNIKDVASYAVDPANFAAGTCVSMASTGLPSKLASAGMRMGVSKGVSQSNCDYTAVLLAGKAVPVLAHLKRARCVVTISSYANLVSGTDDALTIGGVEFTAQAGAATPGDATFQAATANSNTATSLATQINAHATASLLVYAVASSATVTLYSIVDGVGGTGTGNDIEVTYTDNDANIGITLSGLTDDLLTGGSDDIADIDYPVVGGKMYINNVSGKADVAMTGFSTISDAIYVDDPVKTGIDEAGDEVAAVVVDMVGGL